MSEVKRYSCTVLVDASTGFNVEASDPEEAAEKAEMLAAESGATSICHQCSANLDIGDFCGVMVYDEDLDEQVLDTTYGAGQIARLIADYDAIAAQRYEGLAREAELRAAFEDSQAQLVERGKRLAEAEEMLAKAIYRQWYAAEGYVPWVERGNSDKQVEARREAKRQLASPGCADVEQQS